MDRFVRNLLAQTPLDAAQERALARRARSGDSEARDALITAGMRPVAMRAAMRGLRGEELRDAVQAGAVGLIRAVDRFDPERGVRLGTYAWHWIGSTMSERPRREVPVDDVELRTIVADHAEGTGDWDLLGGLPDEQSSVLRLRYGLGDPSREPMSRAAVADRLGLSPWQVRTIEAKAMRHLRVRLAKVVGRAPLRGGADPL